MNLYKIKLKYATKWEKNFATYNRKCHGVEVIRTVPTNQLEKEKKYNSKMDKGFSLHKRNRNDQLTYESGRCKFK